ncbi:gas vesicle protein GvpG [Streptomyces diastatochromogenes]|nr:gas vesicle protein GvpG [Streptomyces diastatochromogenes]
MGLVTYLLTLAVAPVRGIVWVAERVAEQAEEEYYDPAPVWRELADLEGRLVRGEIDQGTFDAREDELLDRLDEITAHRRQTPGQMP